MNDIMKMALSFKVDNSSRLDLNDIAFHSYTIE